MRTPGFCDTFGNYSAESERFTVEWSQENSQRNNGTAQTNLFLQTEKVEEREAEREVER